MMWKNTLRPSSEALQGEDGNEVKKAELLFTPEGKLVREEEKANRILLVQGAVFPFEENRRVKGLPYERRKIPMVIPRSEPRLRPGPSSKELTAMFKYMSSATPMDFVPT